MSTFNGLLLEEEFKGCVVDYFQNEALCVGKAFFLTHFHSDHMKGLFDLGFSNKLKAEPDVKLYCSIISKKFILKNRTNTVHEEQIVTLDQTPIHICPDKVTIRVTPLRAGHCPGSLMLLFEGDGVTSLYSGDFRMTVDDLKRCRYLHSPGSRNDVLDIDTLYLDTTFASEEYEYFPSRQKSRDHIVDIIQQNRGKFEFFAVELTAKTGIEYLMVELYKEFTTLVHVGDSLCQSVVSCIDQLKNVITSDINQSFIHFCVPPNWSMMCDDCPKRNRSSQTMVIRPTAQFFNKHALRMGEVIQESERIVRVAYSSHSSLDELAAFVVYLNPRQIIPTVVSVKEDRNAEDIIFSLKTYIFSVTGFRWTPNRDLD